MSDPFKPSFGTPITEWHRWFAWRPVETVDRGYRWLRPVWRRRIQLHDFLSSYGYSRQWFQFAVDVAAEGVSLVPPRRGGQT